MEHLRCMIEQKVHKLYWDDNINCATTVLQALADIFEIELAPQIIDSAIGMHGAGAYGAQCGLVEGSLMFIGIWGKRTGYDKESIIDFCYDFADEFQKYFSSLLCRDLRPQGFSANDPPHICEGITSKAIEFTLNFIKNRSR